MYEVTTILLVGGASTTALSGDNKTPFEIAEEAKNEGFISAYSDFIQSKEDNHKMMKITALKEELNKKYCIQKNTLTRAQVSAFDAKFELPDFLFTDTAKVGNIPIDLQIHEHLIKPLTKAGFDDMEGMEAISCLAFSKDQAMTNKHRRERLMELGDPNFRPVNLKKLM